MTSKFGILGRLEFLQVIASKFIAGINPAVIHNIEKYYAIKKVHYLTAVEHLEGDYLEFGVFTGSSFTHSIRCTRSMEKIYPGIKNCKFFGFDSFEGFGLLDEGDEHPFYTDENFETSFATVYKRVASAAGSYQFELKEGFFEESLQAGAASAPRIHTHALALPFLPSCMQIPRGHRLKREEGRGGEMGCPLSMFQAG